VPAMSDGKARKDHKEDEGGEGRGQGRTQVTCKGRVDTEETGSGARKEVATERNHKGGLKNVKY